VVGVAEDEAIQVPPPARRAQSGRPYAVPRVGNSDRKNFALGTSPQRCPRCRQLLPERAPRELSLRAHIPALKSLPTLGDRLGNISSKIQLAICLKPAPTDFESNSAPEGCPQNGDLPKSRPLYRQHHIGSTDAIGRQAIKINRHSVRVPVYDRTWHVRAACSGRFTVCLSFRRCDTDVRSVNRQQH
jgi:hypothetical protein